MPGESGVGALTGAVRSGPVGRALTRTLLGVLAGAVTGAVTRYNK